MAILDNRTLVHAANAIGSWEDQAGVAMNVSAGTDNFIEGTGSIQHRTSNNTRGVLWNYGSAQDLTDQVQYMWFNMTAASLLAAKASHGMVMRFTGPTVTDFFDIDIAGNDTYGGGWKLFAVDASVAKTASDQVGGTPPLVSAVQRVGIVVTTTGSVPGADDNIFMDAYHTLDTGVAGITIGGQNVGLPWTMQDVIDAGDITDTTKAWGTITRLNNGTISCNTPIQFGLDDSTQDEFEDINEVFGWEVADVPDGFYGFSGVAGTGQMDVTLGVKSGTGNDATGAQGFVVVSGGPRWFMDFSTDADIDSAGLYGCQFSNGEVLDLASVSVDMATVVMVDCNKAHFSNAKVVRPTVVAANTADGVAFCDTDDLGDIAYGSFSFSDGHGIEVLSGGPASQSNVGNVFLGAYGGTPGDNGTPASGSTDAMIYNNSTAVKTFNRSGGGTLPSFRNGTSAESDDVASISLTFTPLETGSDVSVFPAGSNVPSSETDSSGTSFVASVGAGQSIDYKVYKDGFLVVEKFATSFGATQNVQVTQLPDGNFDPVD